MYSLKINLRSKWFRPAAMIFCVIRAVVIDFQQWVILVYLYNLYICIYKHIYINSLVNTLIFVFPFHPKPDGRPPQSGSARGFLPLQSFSWPQSLHICSGIRFYVMLVLNGVSGVRGSTWGAFAPVWGRGGQITWDYWPQTAPGSLSVVNCGCVVIYSRHMSRQKRSEKLCWVYKC